jgi:hypothetical protein
VLSVLASLFVCLSHFLGRSTPAPRPSTASSPSVSRAVDAADCRYPNQLLVHVAVCELGLGLLALVHVFRYCSVDGAAITCRAMSSRACSASVALEMFLLLASVGWFGAAIVHLFVSVSNPFANYRAQLRVYHAAVWSCSALLAVLVPVVLYSDRSQAAYDMTRPELCRAVALSLPMLPHVSANSTRDRVVSNWQRLNMAYWGALFLVVVLLVVAAQAILVVGWWRSNSGTVIALKARRRMMKRMTVYVHTLNATWLALLVTFFAFRSDSQALAHVPVIDRDGAGTYRGMDAMSAAFYYSLAAKGFFTCVVWIAVNKRDRNSAAYVLRACRRATQCALRCLPCCFRRDRTLERGAGALTDRLDPDIDSRVATVCSGAAGDNFRASLAALEAASPPIAMSTPMVRGELVSASASSSSSSSSYSSTYSSSDQRVKSWASENNETLQREIIYYTVCGITKSILRAAQRAREAEASSSVQQLLVGAGRDSAFANNPTLEHVQALRVQQSPRAYCLRGHEVPSARTRSTSDQGHQPSGGDGEGDSERIPRRFSMYPVSQVPFELFESEIELQSHGATTLDNAELTEQPSPSTPSTTEPPTSDPLALSSRRRSALFASRRLSLTNREARSASLSMTLLDSEPKPKLFMDFAPRAFREVREAFGLSEATYLASFRSTAKERVSAGSSGAFMFFTGDNALIVKSMRAKECRALVRMAPAYAAYITAHPASRLIRVFGCHRLRLYGRSFYFVVMANVLHSAHHCPAVSEKYDIKGSWVDRRAHRPQRGERAECADCHAPFIVGDFGSHRSGSSSQRRHIHVADTVLKDLDFARELRLSESARQTLVAQLSADSAFLKSMGIMDYSLLIGVHSCRFGGKAAAPTSREEGGNGGDGAGWHLAPLVGEAAESGDATEVYFVGIIDILQEWDWEKKIERAGKVLIGKSSRGISAVAPHWYCRRFQARVAQLLVGGPPPEELAEELAEVEEDQASEGLTVGRAAGEEEAEMKDKIDSIV